MYVCKKFIIYVCIYKNIRRNILNNYYKIITKRIHYCCWIFEWWSYYETIFSLVYKNIIIP